MPLQRYKLVIAYRGTRYHGWQQQPAMENWVGEPPPAGQGIPTIQEELTRALVSVVQHPVTVTGSSRTDAGVHAKGQVVHFDTHQVQIPREGLRRAVNARLPSDILIRQIRPVPETFDAVRSTTTKRYQYFIWNHGDRPVFFADLAWHRWQRLDVDAMTAAAAHLVGQHDFASFARPGHGRENTVRTVLALRREPPPARSWSSASRGPGSCGTWCGSWSGRWWRWGWAGTRRRTCPGCSPPATAGRPARRPRRTGYTCSGSGSPRRKRARGDEGHRAGRGRGRSPEPAEGAEVARGGGA